MSTWGGEHRGKPAIERFLRRFLTAGLSGRSEDILVNCSPWRTRIAVVFVDRAFEADRTDVYANRAVLYAFARCGRITRQEDFEDTQKVEAFDAGCTSTASRRRDDGRLSRRPGPRPGHRRGGAG